MADEVELHTLARVIHEMTEPYTETQNSVISRTLAVPPVTPADGDRYIVAAVGSGAWTGFTARIARYDGTTWSFYVPAEGSSVWVDDEDKQVTFDGVSWRVTSAAGRLTALNKRMTARLTAADGDQACNTALLAQPIASGHLTLRVNGVGVPDLGDGTHLGVSAYFTAPGSTVAKAWSALQVGDVLRWNGSVAGYQLDTGDVLDLDFEVEG